MSSHYHLTDQELADLEFEHRHAFDKRYADRVKAVYLLGKGWSVTKIAQALLIDRETVRNHFKRYRKGGLAALQRNDAGGSDAALTEEQQRLLDHHLRENLYLTAKEIAHYVEQTWQVTYSESGMTQLLHRLGYVYKKPKLIPGKANAEQQKDFVKRYQTLKANKAPDDPIYFMDATHPQHNPVAGYGWIKRGRDHEIPSNTGRQRININGAIDCARLCPIIRYDDTINAQSTVALLQQIEQQHPAAARIYVICDNARYYRSQIVTEYLSDSKIELIFLPPYAPNLNLIERFWRFFKKEILYGKYYETFALFRRACDDFFAASERYKEALRSLLTDNFQIIDCARVPKFEVR
jgi:transposase